MLCSVIHTHRHGVDRIIFRCDNPENLTEEIIVETFGIDFEPEEEETLHWAEHPEEEILDMGEIS